MLGGWVGSFAGLAGGMMIAVVSKGERRAKEGLCVAFFMISSLQVDRYIVSFARSELNPDEAEDCMKGLAIGCEIARKNAPDNQSAVFLQKDGKGGLVHLHIITNDVNMSDYRGINPSAYAHFHFQKIVDEVCQQYFDLAKPETQPEKVNQSVRGARAKNEQIRAANELERKQATEEGRKVNPDKIRAERYIWQDDLRERIKKAAAEARDEADFARQLRLSGVELVPHEHKDGTVTYLHPATKKQPPHYTYELVDTSGFPDKIPPNLKSKSYKLGANYQPEGVKKLFGTEAPSFQAEQQDEAPPVVLEMPMPSFSTPRKPAQKPATATKRPSEDKEMEEVKKQAAFDALAVMQQIYGWQDQPRTIGPDGKEHYDFKEWDRQLQEKDTVFEQFTRWRVARRKELAKDGLKLPPIYAKDKVTGHVSVIRSELETQFRDFLERRDHPEKYAVQEQPEQAAPMPMEQHHEKPEQPSLVKPTRAKQQAEPEKPSQAELERQEVAAQRSVLFEEMQRLLAAKERRWKEQEDEEEDTVVKN